ncbi:hypothetical protein Salat_1894600 [Sesamum alatum]|uniref:Uncharacterized protein n=1 Tax=Sesamum alatum TaxID=300844 RepID=A0AAE1Y3S7_9LAMI|nr:hypothetical protein Salat_1894600 [Sesamum alatum]
MQTQTLTPPRTEFSDLTTRVFDTGDGKSLSELADLTARWVARFGATRSTQSASGVQTPRAPSPTMADPQTSLDAPCTQNLNPSVTAGKEDDNALFVGNVQVNPSPNVHDPINVGFYNSSPKTTILYPFGYTMGEIPQRCGACEGFGHATEQCPKVKKVPLGLECRVCYKGCAGSYYAGESRASCSGCTSMQQEEGKG